VTASLGEAGPRLAVFPQLGHEPPVVAHRVGRLQPRQNKVLHTVSDGRGARR
jgi:hypothetical protein